MGYILIFMSLFFKLWDYIRFCKLINIGTNISVSDNELAKQLKRRYTDSYTLNRPVNNTEAYVEKILAGFHQYRRGSTFLCKLSLLFFTGFYILLLINLRAGTYTALKTLILSITALAVYFAADRLFDTGSLRSTFIMSAADYLDNTLKNRFTINPAALRREESVPYTESRKASELPCNEQISHNMPSDNIADTNIAPPEIHDKNPKNIINRNNDSELFASIINEFL